MTRTARWLIVIVGGMVLLLGFTVAATAATVYRSGTISVEVQDRDGGISVRVPAALANIALAFVPDTLIEEAVREAPPEVHDVLPAVRDAWTELRNAPDFVLVEVDHGNGDGGIRVEKRSGRLLVEVDEPGTQVRVAVPMSTLNRLARLM